MAAEYSLWATPYINDVLLHFLSDKLDIEQLKGKSRQEIIDYVVKNFKLHSEGNKYQKLDIIINSVKDLIKSQRGRINYLDIGCGSGAKTRYIGRALKASIFGADISQWGSYSPDRAPAFEYRIIQTKPYNIPYAAGYFDVISIILTLHHCEDEAAVLREIKRLLKPDGYVIIVEHDVENKNQEEMLHLQHDLYTNCFNEPPIVPGNYRSMAAYEEFLQNNGFKIIRKDKYPRAMSYDFQYYIIAQPK